MYSASLIFLKMSGFSAFLSPDTSTAFIVQSTMSLRPFTIMSFLFRRGFIDAKHVELGRKRTPTKYLRTMHENHICRISQNIMLRKMVTKFGKTICSFDEGRHNPLWHCNNHTYKKSLNIPIISPHCNADLTWVSCRLDLKNFVSGSIHVPCVSYSCI